jgi:hypothetical protein
VSHPTIPPPGHLDVRVSPSDSAGPTGRTRPRRAQLTAARRRRPRRRAVIVVAVLLVVGAAVPAVAQTVFRDVSPGYVHAGAIERMRVAGITLGCIAGPDRFCPLDNVTRAQMASFMSRSGTTAASDRSATTLTAGSGNVNGVAVTVDVRGPGESGGRQNVVLSGNVTVHHDGALTDCPCEVQAFVYRARDERQGPSSWTELSGEVSGSGSTSVSVPVDWAVAIDSGRNEQFRLAVFVDGTTASGLRAEGTLSAVTAPFGSVPR